MAVGAPLRDDQEAARIAGLLDDALKGKIKIPQEAQDGMMAALRKYHSNRPEDPRRHDPTISVPAGLTAEEAEKIQQRDLSFILSAFEGLTDAPLNLAEYAMLGVDALVRENAFPNAQANVNRVQDAVRKQRQEISVFYDEIRLHKAPGTQKNEIAAIMTEGLMYLPLSFLGTGSTYVRVLGGNALIGGIIGGAASVKNAEELSDTFMGMTIGTLLGAGSVAFNPLRAVAGARSFIARQFVTELERDLAKSRLVLEKQIQELTGNPEFSFSIAQLAGDNPWLISAELGALGRQGINKQAKNLQILLDSLEAQAAKMGQLGLGPGAIVSKLGAGMKTAVKEMRGSAQRNYGKQLDAIVTASGDDLVLDGRRYLTALAKMQDEMLETLQFGGKLPPKFAAHIRRVDELVEPYATRPGAQAGTFEVVLKESDETIRVLGTQDAAEAIAGNLNKAEGGFIVAELESVLKGHQKLLSGETSFFDNANFGSLDAAVKMVNSELVHSMKGNTGAAVRSLQVARASYRTDLQKISVLKNSTLSKVFGQTDEALQKTLADPKVALDKLLALDDPQAMANVRQTIQEVAPELLGELKATLLRRVLFRARAKGGAVPIGELETNMRTLGELLSGPGKTESFGRIGIRLFNPQEQQELIRTGDAIRTLLVTYVRSAKKDFAGVASDTGINVSSRSKEFMTRFLVRFLAKSKNLEALLINPQGRRALITIAEEGPGSLKTTAAMAYFVMIVGGIEAEEADKKKRQAFADRPAFIDQ